MIKEVCTSADDLAKEFQMLNQMVKDGVKMLGEIGSRYDWLKVMNDALKETVKLKDVDITGLVPRVVDKYSKATFKAHYKLLKVYKQGLLVDGDVDEKILLHEESLAKAKASTSTAKLNVEPLAPVVSRPTIVEP
ncbi:hypothetical protein TIFTF001_033185 [Ficus carica]|uniref:Uncharacterized protein n=1 Tax=Ficus carica TaxID=3494 RepID=A0AA88J3D6_FICCA|nr:hypothetical protein TIFTF001_033185 [Ficus carica]